MTTVGAFSLSGSTWPVIVANGSLSSGSVQLSSCALSILGATNVTLDSVALLGSVSWTHYGSLHAAAGHVRQCAERHGDGGERRIAAGTHYHAGPAGMQLHTQPKPAIR